MVQLIPKRGRTTISVNKLFLYGSVGLLILVLAAYAGLFYYESHLSNKLQNLNLQISQVGTPAQKQMEQKVFDAKNKIGTFSDILNADDKTSKVFALVDQFTHPKVWFTDFDLKTSTNELVLDGSTSNFQTLGQQIDVLRTQSMIKEIALSDLAIGNSGETNFKLDLTLDPKIFK